MKLPFETKKVRILTKKSGFKLRKLEKRSAEQLLNFGIINLDKPAGPKSIHCVNKIRGILEQPKAGHGGTLDPAVTGVLPIGIGKAVKILSVLITAGKVYVGQMRLHGDVNKTKLKAAFKKFIGEIEQLPPKISAVRRVLRKRKVYWLKIIKIKERDVDFEVGCEAGTYIRKLCHDIGQYLDVGAHMSSLRRIQSGPLKIKNSVTLEKIRANYKRHLKTKSDIYIQKIILPPEEAVGHLPKVWIEEKVETPLSHGSPIYVPGIVKLTDNIKRKDVVAIFSLRSKLLGLGIAAMSSNEILDVSRGLAIRTDVVLI